MRYYDPKDNRLVYVKSRANERFWDEHWGAIDTSMLYRSKVPPFSFVVDTTRKHLPTRSLILEGGAGLAQNSWYLHLSSYRTIALDFAPKTIDFVRQHRPEVQPTLGDVRNLPFKDESVDGYWSLGVIEHFYDGYDAILREMHRVIRKDGYVFLTFPHMSKLRQIKARKGRYEIWTGNQVSGLEFYQFALDDQRVIDAFERYGFKLIAKKCFDGVKGFKDEIRFGKTWIQSIYEGRTLRVKIVRKLLDILLSPWASHMALMVFKKKSHGIVL
jgi:SAM-dependent methyltransferase